MLKETITLPTSHSDEIFFKPLLKSIKKDIAKIKIALKGLSVLESCGYTENVCYTEDVEEFLSTLKVKLNYIYKHPKKFLDKLESSDNSPCRFRISVYDNDTPHDWHSDYFPTFAENTMKFLIATGFSVVLITENGSSEY